MAGTKPTTAPDATVVVNDDGSVTAHGPRAWVWCTDESTGARMDIPASMLPKPGLTPVPGYSVNLKTRGRDAKSAVELSTLGNPDAPKTTKRGAGQ